MIGRIAMLAILLIIVSLARFGVRAHSNQEIDGEALQLRISNAESRLALGLKLHLRSATISDLILLTGVSDALANNIHQRKDEVIEHATRSGKFSTIEELRALERVRGIGPSKALALSRLLALTRDSELSLKVSAETEKVD